MQVSPLAEISRYAVRRVRNKLGQGEVGGVGVFGINAVSPQASNLKTGLQGVTAANGREVVGHRIAVGVELEKVHAGGKSRVRNVQIIRRGLKRRVMTKLIHAVKPKTQFVDHRCRNQGRVRDLRVVKARRKDRGAGRYQIGRREVLMVIVVAKGQPLFSKLQVPPGDVRVLVVRAAGVWVVGIGR